MSRRSKHGRVEDRRRVRPQGQARPIRQSHVVSHDQRAPHHARPARVGVAAREDQRPETVLDDAVRGGPVADVAGNAERIAAAAGRDPGVAVERDGHLAVDRVTAAGDDHGHGAAAVVQRQPAAAGRGAGDRDGLVRRRRSGG